MLIDLEMDYTNYRAEDFLANDLFVGHLLAPSKESRAYWDTVSISSTINSVEWELAMELFDLVQLGLKDYAAQYLSEDKIQSLLNRIQEVNSIPATKKAKVFEYRKAWLAAASLLLIILGLGWWTKRTQPSDYRSQVAGLQKGYTELVNSSSEEKHFVLPDSSQITLHRHSRLSFDKDFNVNTRKVILSGAAEFEVKKNARKPFYVLANKVVTKVLGTSFLVSAFEKDQDVSVMVHSGHVSVSSNFMAKTMSVGKEANGLVLTPNQQAIFSKKGEKFNKTVVDDPEILGDPQRERHDFTYDDERVAIVFQQLQEAYGIHIQFDKESLAGCGISASLNNESFEDKLDIICKTVNASFHKIDGQIIIQGGYCK